MNLLAVLLGVASAACFAASSALEQHAAKREKPTRTLDPRLLLRLVRRPLWLSGWIPDLAGTGLQAVALNVGALALVEPLLLSGVFMAIPLEAALERRRPHGRDVLVVAFGVAGLAAFLLAADPRAGIIQPSMSAWFAVGIGVGAVFAGCLVVAWRVLEAARGVLLGIAAGVLFGTAAALLKTLTDIIATHPAEVFRHWQLYALLVVGFAAMALSQNAFQAGPIAAPLTAIALLDPLVGVLVGVTAFQEEIHAEPFRIVIQVIGVAAMSVCIWLASTTRST